MKEYYWHQNTDGWREGDTICHNQSGTIVYRRNGDRHRTDGPAVMYPEGSKYEHMEVSWWVYERQYFDNKSFQKATNKSDEEMLALVIKWGDVK